MEIKTHYLDGTIEVYSTDSHFSSAGLFRSNAVCATTCTLDVVDIRNGLFVLFWKHDFTDPLEVIEDEDAGAPIGMRRPPAKLARIEYFGEDQVLDYYKISHAASVSVDGETVLYRVSPESGMVIWTTFMRQVNYYLSNEGKMPYIDAAVQLYLLLSGDVKARIPGLFDFSGDPDDVAGRDKAIARHIGWEVEPLLDLVAKHREALAAANRIEVDEDDIVHDEAIDYDDNDEIVYDVV